MIRVGMVGLGRMGSGMALNIAKAGFPLSLYDTQEGLAQELRESWVRDKHLPSGEQSTINRSGKRANTIKCPRYTPSAHHIGQTASKDEATPTRTPVECRHF